jgi:hypothetical protein
MLALVRGRPLRSVRVGVEGSTAGNGVSSGVILDEGGEGAAAVRE